MAIKRRSETYYWTSRLYSYAEHFFWVPRAIFKKTTPELSKKAKEHGLSWVYAEEVALNEMLAILLRLAPPRVVDALLSAGVKTDGTGFAGCRLAKENYRELLLDVNITYPDAVLYSDDGRILLEIKIDAALEAEQLWKYLFLASRAHESGEQGKDTLFLLTKRNLVQSFKRPARSQVFGDRKSGTPADVLMFLRTADPPMRLGNRILTQMDRMEMMKAAGTLNVAWMSWQMFGDVLAGEVASLTGSRTDEGAGVLVRLYGDFLAELRDRGLWK